MGRGCALEPATACIHAVAVGVKCGVPVVTWLHFDGTEIPRFPLPCARLRWQRAAVEIEIHHDSSRQTQNPLGPAF